VATQGTVKAAGPEDLEALGASILMSNAYHLALRPGPETVRALGGLHRLAGWGGPLMADSGGFQVFSLAGRRRLDGDGVTFQSHVDGTPQRVTPESLIDLQELLGADLIMPLDVCTAYPASRATVERDAALTLKWLARSVARRRRPDQALYGVVQGGTHLDLRAEAARAVAAQDVDGFAIGGVSVGEPKELRAATIEAVVPLLADGAPRHLLGVGHPDDIVEGIARGMDTFDCVMPTRVARNAAALTLDGRLNLRQAAYRHDLAPLEAGCCCPA
jgi:queuine tRNA-ribosyltransferase